MRGLLLIAALALAGSPALAENLPGFTPVSASTVAVSTATFGYPLDPGRGPWVIGEVLFQGNKNVSEAALRDRVRARRGMLYTPADISSDLSGMRELGGILGAKAGIYAIPDRPVSPSLQAISISTMMARIVYTVEEKTILLPGLKPRATEQQLTPGVPLASLSGVVDTPTAYRGINQFNRPGLAFDVNTVYYIGRLYGKNSLSRKRTNYIDRVGVWFLTGDAKMQIQSEGRWRPAVAVGGRGIFTFRDAPQPKVQGNFTLTVSPKRKQGLSDGYIVASKQFGKLYTSAGYAQGNAGDRIAQLTEFLAPEALAFLAGQPNQKAESDSVVFGSLMFLPKPQFPLAVEVLKPNGMALNPILFNFKIGYFLKLNFDIAYLRFNGGWDLMGMFQFRYTHFPRKLPRKKL